MNKAEITRKILDILRNGHTVELHLERGRLVIVDVHRRAIKTDFEVNNDLREKV